MVRLQRGFGVRSGQHRSNRSDEHFLRVEPVIRAREDLVELLPLLRVCLFGVQLNVLNSKLLLHLLEELLSPILLQIHFRIPES